MRSLTAACPACGAPVEFRFKTSLVSVCEFCQSAVARSDKKVEDHGKVSDLALTETRIRRGMTGKYEGKEFHVTGRVQYQHSAGGYWDEWYLSFPGNRWGWLADAQGKLNLTFEKRLKKASPLPDFDSLEVGKRFQVRDRELTVAEKGAATVHAAEGEIPWSVRPGESHRYADLHGEGGEFATLDYGEEPGRFFLGREVALEGLELSGEEWAVDEPEATVEALQLNCPECGGPIQLHVPDKSERVVCINCASLLDVRDGKLKYFESLKQKQAHPVLPLGWKGTLFGNTFTVIGFMERFAKVEGATYPWTEYLLYDADQGFRWLVHNDRHWSFVEPISVHDVRYVGDTAYYKGRTFNTYDRGTAYVRYVLGEFYWRVRAGDQVITRDDIAPPHMISSERSVAGDAEEVNISLGTYLPVDDVERAFGVKSLRRPFGVGAIQPARKYGAGLFAIWPMFVTVLFVTYLLFDKPGSKEGADGALMLLAMIGVSALPFGILLHKHSFETQRWANSDYSPYATDE